MFGVLRSLCHTVRAQHEVRTLKPGIAQPGSADPICREQGKERLGPQAISQQGPVEIMDTSALRLPCEVGASRACSGSHAAPSHPPLQRRRPLCSAASSSAFAPRGRRALRTALLPGACPCLQHCRLVPACHSILAVCLYAADASCDCSGVETLRHTQRRRPPPHQVKHRASGQDSSSTLCPYPLREWLCNCLLSVYK